MLHDEIDAHLQMAIADRAAQGESKEAARQAALREFGNVALVQDVTREAWGWTRLEWLAQDFRYTLRQIRRSPSFAATIVGTLGLGITAAAAMFTVVDHVLFATHAVSRRRPASGDSGIERLVDLYLAVTLVRHWRDGKNRVGRSAKSPLSAKLSGRNFLSRTDSWDREIDGERISPNLFRVLGIQAILGHGLIPEAPSSVSGKNAGTTRIERHGLERSVWRRSRNSW